MATHVERSIEVEVPVRTAYDQWTQFEEFPRFMSGVQEVRQIGDALTHWVAEIAGVRREWDAAILEQVPDQKVAWAATTGATNAGAVYFQAVGEDRTQVRLALDYEPEGLVERVADVLDLVDRQAVADLDRFKEFIEQRGSATGGWRGRVEDGDVQGGGAATSGVAGGTLGDVETGAAAAATGVAGGAFADAGSGGAAAETGEEGPGDVSGDVVAVGPTGGTHSTLDTESAPSTAASSLDDGPGVGHSGDPVAVDPERATDTTSSEGSAAWSDTDVAAAGDPVAVGPTGDTHTTLDTDSAAPSTAASYLDDDRTGTSGDPVAVGPTGDTHTTLDTDSTAPSTAASYLDDDTAGTGGDPVALGPTGDTHTTLDTDSTAPPTAASYLDDDTAGASGDPVALGPTGDTHTTLDTESGTALSMAASDLDDGPGVGHSGDPVAVDPERAGDAGGTEGSAAWSDAGALGSGDPLFVEPEPAVGATHAAGTATGSVEDPAAVHPGHAGDPGVTAAAAAVGGGTVGAVASPGWGAAGTVDAGAAAGDEPLAADTERSRGWTDDADTERARGWTDDAVADARGGSGGDPLFVDPGYGSDTGGSQPTADAATGASEVAGFGTNTGLASDDPSSGALTGDPEGRGEVGTFGGETGRDPEPQTTGAEATTMGDARDRAEDAPVEVGGRPAAGIDEDRWAVGESGHTEVGRDIADEGAAGEQVVQRDFANRDIVEEGVQRDFANRDITPQDIAHHGVVTGMGGARHATGGGMYSAHPAAESAREGMEGDTGFQGLGPSRQSAGPADPDETAGRAVDPEAPRES